MTRVPMRSALKELGGKRVCNRDRKQDRTSPLNRGRRHGNSWRTPDRDRSDHRTREVSILRSKSAKECRIHARAQSFAGPIVRIMYIMLNQYAANHHLLPINPSACPVPACSPQHDQTALCARIAGLHIIATRAVGAAHQMQGPTRQVQHAHLAHLLTPMRMPSRWY